MLRMTMLSFRVPDADAVEVQRWSTSLGIDRSDLLREALHLHLVALRGAHDAEKWERSPASDGERALAEIAEWGPAEDWSDWNNAAG